MPGKPKQFLNKTSYPGGIDALRKFIDQNMHYPEEAIKQNISGTVSLTFDVDYKGRISNIKIKHKLGYGCDEEAMRLLKLMKYSSTKNRGLFVVFHETIHIVFDLKKFIANENKKKKAEIEKPSSQNQPVINYTLKPISVSTSAKNTESKKIVVTLKFN